MSRQPDDQAKRRIRKADVFDKKKTDDKPHDVAGQFSNLEKAASVTESVAPQSPEQPRMTIRYIDKPECTETFSDSVNGVWFDGQLLRIELGVTRLDEIKPNSSPTGRRYPASHLVMTSAAAVDLINRLQQVGAAMAQAGVVKTNATHPKKT